MSQKDFPTDEELQTLKAAAKAGDPEAMTWLGQLHLREDVVRYSPKMAFDLFTRAAERGHADAQAHLGLMYQESLYGKKNDEKAEELLRLAAIKGSTLAIQSLETIWNTYNQQIEGNIRNKFRSVAEGYDPTMLLKKANDLFLFLFECIQKQKVVAEELTADTLK